MNNIHDKVVIVTGASSGIGKALTEKYARSGATVVAAARSLNKLKQLEAALKEEGLKVLALDADVSKEADCKALIDSTLKAYGRIDVLINNAGISMRANFLDVELDVLKRLMDVNFWGTVYCTKYALPHLLKTKGSLIGVSSIAGFIGLPGRTGYSASKFAMHGFLDTVRTENLKSGLHVMIAAPGFTASNVRLSSLTADGSPQGESPRKEEKMMTAEEVAERIFKAQQKRKRTLILTFVEGKLTVCLSKWLPKLLSKLTYNHMAKEPDSPIK